MFVRVGTSLEDENKFKLHILEPLEHRGKLISQSGPVCGYIPYISDTPYISDCALAMLPAQGREIVRADAAEE